MSERVYLAPEAIDAIAQRVVELLRDGPTPDRTRLLTAHELADLLGVDRGWVYEHREQLGGIPLGEGKRPRWRFNPDRALAARQHHVDPEPEPSRPRRRAQTTSTPLLPIRGQDTA